MRDDFCAFILTHGRPDKVHTYRTLQSHGYTGKVFIVIDDEDPTGDAYRRNFGEDNVLVFSKDEVGRYTDQFDNFPDRRTVLWARNACWDLATQMGYRHFIQLDDDYIRWRHRRWGYGFDNDPTRNSYHGWNIKNLDAIFGALVRLLETTPIKTVALSQGGDHGSTDASRPRFLRKAMNSFVCDTGKPFLFRGRINEDVTTYVVLGRIGELFFSDMQLQLDQLKTQTNSGGMTEMYLDSGTYVKSFYTVMAAPSCTHIGLMGSLHRRLHHKINWRRAVPLIIPELLR